MTKAEAPFIDWAAMSPLVALVAGLCIVLLSGLLRPRWIRSNAVPLLTVATFATTIGLAVWQWNENTEIVERALAIDDLSMAITILCCATGIGTVALSWRGVAPREAGHGEYHALLICAVLGMLVLAGAQNLVSVFVGYELLSIPLYVLCATEMRRSTSLESGLKYLIVGSVGSATLLYGLALLYGATGSTDFATIAEAVDGVADDPLFLTSLALIVTGLAFKASIAPFHQWTPDVYEGAPTPVTAFMAVATKAAAFGILLRLFDVALIDAADVWAPALAVLATISIVVGNVGALGQSSLKRILAYSSIAQAGYMLVGVVVSTKLGVQATLFYLAVYLLMNLAAFGVIVVRERETGLGDDLSSLHGLGADRPALAWPMTIAMLALAGLPGTAGFFGKIYLIDAAVSNGWEWLAVVIVLGSAISLAYYLKVIAAVWMRAPVEAGASVARRAIPVVSGGSDEASRGDDDSVGAGDGDPDPGNVAGGGHGGDEHGGAPVEPDRGVADHGDEYVEASEDSPGTGEPDEDSNAPGRPGGAFGTFAPEDTGPPPAPRGRHGEVVALSILCAVATVAAGLYPDPLFDLARDVGEAFTNLL